MSMRTTLGHIELEQLLLLANSPPELVLPEDRSNQNAHVRSFAAFLAGAVTWGSVVQRCLDNEDLEGAVRIASSTKARLEKEVRERLAQRWTAWLASLLAQQQDALSQLQGIPAGAQQARRDAVAWIELISVVIVPGELPSAEHWRQARNLEELLADLLHGGSPSELDRLKALAEREQTEDLHELQATATRAWNRLLLESTGPLAEVRSQALLRVLPQLVLERRVHELTLLADTSRPIGELDIPVNRVVEIPWVAEAGATFPARVRMSKDYDALQTFSRLVARSAPQGGPAIESIDDFERVTERASRRTDFAGAERTWLAAAAASQGEFQRMALGRGLLAAACARAERDDLAHARPLLLDAVELLARFELDARVFRTATQLAVATRVWPYHRTRLGPNAVESLADWVREPARAFTAGKVRPAELNDQAAQLWADELSDDAVRETFLETISADLGDDATLYRQCVTRLLTPARLLRFPQETCDRMLWLLRDAGESESLREALAETVHELNTLQEGVAPRAVGERLAHLVPRLETAFSNLGAKDSAPVRAAAEILPEILRLVGGEKHTAREAPDLTIGPVGRVYYPDECSDEVLLPLVLRNEEAAGPARNLQVALRVDSPSGQDPAVRLLESVATVPDLGPGDEREIIFSFSTTPNIQEITGEVRLVPEVRTDELIHKTKAFSIEFRPSEGRRNRRSPYTTGPTVAGDHFVGRTAVLAQVVDRLLSDVRALPVVVGIRRIGKTSLVTQALRNAEVERRFYTCYWSIDDRPDDDSSANFLADLAEAVRDAVPKEYHQFLEFKREALRQNPYGAFEVFLRSLQSANLPKRVVVAIDEFDRLLKLIDDGKAREAHEGRSLPPQDIVQPAVLASLRKAVMAYDSITFMLAGLPALTRKAGYESRLFGLMSRTELSPFTEAEAAEILESGSAVMRFAPAARMEVFRATGLQPYLLQVVCDCLFHRMKYSGREVVAPIDVRTVIEQEILPNESNLSDYISLIDGDWQLLFGLASALDKAPRGRTFVTAHEVARALEQVGVTQSEEEVREALGNLAQPPGGAEHASSVIERPIVERAPNDKGRFRFVVGLLAQHLLSVGPYK